MNSSRSQHQVLRSLDKIPIKIKTNESNQSFSNLYTHIQESSGKSYNQKINRIRKSSDLSTQMSKFLSKFKHKHINNRKQIKQDSLEIIKAFNPFLPSQRNHQLKIKVKNLPHIQTEEYQLTNNEAIKISQQKDKKLSDNIEINLQNNIKLKRTKNNFSNLKKKQKKILSKQQKTILKDYLSFSSDLKGLKNINRKVSLEKVSRQNSQLEKLKQNHTSILPRIPNHHLNQSQTAILPQINNSKSNREYSHNNSRRKSDNESTIQQKMNKINIKSSRNTRNTRNSLFTNTASAIPNLSHDEDNSFNQNIIIEESLLEYLKDTEEIVKRQKVNKKQWIQINPLNMQTEYNKMNRICERKIINGSSIHISKKQNSCFKVPSTKQLNSFIQTYLPQYFSIDKIIKNGNFGFDYKEDEYLYFGETIQGQQKIKHGKGVLVTKKYIYEGEWEHNSRKNGLQIGKGGTYKGQFRDDLKNGTGEFHWFNGETYNGQFKNGLKDGSGMWRANNGDSYIGQWRKGKVQGYGIHQMKTGQIYEGEFKDFLKHGKGFQTLPNGDEYRGMFNAGIPTGKGQYRWKNGYRYVGDFVDGLRHGKGTILYENQVIYEGQFLKDMISGNGEARKLSSDDNKCIEIYKGEFLNGKKHGYGVLRLLNKKVVYQGNWQNDHYLERQQVQQ